MQKIFFTALSLFISTITMAQAEPIKLHLCYDVSANPPYFEGNGAVIPPAGNRGLFIEAAYHSAPVAGVDLSMTRLPWKRCISGVKVGKFDGFMVAIWTQERAEFTRFPMKDGKLDTTRSMLSAHYHYFENRMHPIIWDQVNRLPRMDQVIAAPRGFVVTKKLKAQGINVIENLTPSAGFEKLLKNQISAYAIAREALPTEAKKSPLLRRIDPAIMVSHLFTPISHNAYKQNPENIEKFWTELAKYTLRPN